MPGFLTNVVKGGSNGRADRRLSHRKGETVAEFRQRLELLLNRFISGKPLHEIAAEQLPIGRDERVVRTPQEEQHTKDEFLGDDPTKCFFPQMPGQSEDEIVRGLRARIARGDLVPVLCGSAAMNIGPLRLMQAMIDLLPSPVAAAPYTATNPATQA